MIFDYFIDLVKSNYDKAEIYVSTKIAKFLIWAFGKRFRRIRDLAGIKDLRIHDLRHFAATMLFIEGVSDAIIRKMTGHRSDELERYKHLSPSFSQQTTGLYCR
jgi:integrase